MNQYIILKQSKKAVGQEEEDMKEKITGHKDYDSKCSM